MPEPRLRADPAERIAAPRHGRGGSRPPRPPRRRRPHTRAARLLRLAILLALWVAILGGAALGYFALTLPRTSELAGSARRPSIRILAADGSLIATYGDLYGRPLRLQDMSPYLPEAVIATEDRRFFSNFGIDPIGIVRAAMADLAAGHVVEGGSTITQQLARNLFLTPERSFARKIRETLLALWLDHRFTKRQILEIYLNRVYFGAGTYGVDAAAHRYFGKSARQIDLYQSAMLAGLLKAPTRFNPLHGGTLAAARTRQVLQNMVATGFITEREAAVAAQQPEATALAPSHRAARYFADWIADQVADYAAADASDLTVTTTLDPRLQHEAEAAISGTLAHDGARDKVGQGALVAMTPDGAVRAMVGGKSYDASQFNRATQAQRQPGSAFKPFVYLAGLEAGLQPTDHFVDAPIHIGSWHPRDYDGRYLGDMTMAEALARSVNTIAVEVALRAGIDNIVAVAHRLGITSPLTRDPSIALGSDAVNLLELVSAYAPFPNGGIGVWPYGIVEIRDSAGRVVFRRHGSGPGRVISPELDATMNRMLEGVIGYGTGRAASLPRPAAGKTGTTQDYRDAWFIGYTAGLVAGVWFGNDDDTPMRNVTGGSLPAAAWRRFMLAATRPWPIRPLPDGVAAPVVAAAAPPSHGLFDNFFGLFAPSPRLLPAGSGGEGR
ncbi:MAG: transglycosylase domain-containing protein [Stellaceae bacterium]